MASEEALLLAARELQSAADEAVYNDAVRVTKIFSGIFFAGLAGWLSMANGTKLSFIQQAALEKRLTVCCFLGVYVGSFSAFFNFFQLTEATCTPGWMMSFLIAKAPSLWTFRGRWNGS